MAKPKRARLKGGNETLEDNGLLAHGKRIVLNIEGKIDPSAAATTLRIVARVFFRVDGFPFSSKLFQNDVTIAAGREDFTLTADIPSFVPRQKAIHSFRVLAWDITSAAEMPKGVDEVRTHVVRLRVVA